MDAFLGKLTQHAMNYAIRSGITITASYAIGQCSRLLKTVDGSVQRDELMRLQERLDTKIRIVSPAIDLIELISARGNTTLESAVSLTKTIRWEIQSLGQRFSKAAAAEEASTSTKINARTRAAHEAEIKHILRDMRRLLERIEDAVPLINLAITTSGAKLTTQLPSSVSPSRLLQASMFLTMGDNIYNSKPGIPAQIGPTFVLSLYMLFSGHSRKDAVHLEDGPRQTTWKEVLHKTHVRLMRVPLSSSSNLAEDNYLQHYQQDSNSSENRSHEFSYELEMVEDFDDDRMHTPEEGAGTLGIKESFPVFQVSRIFYADTGKILDIGVDSESNNPILLLKRDVSAISPRRKMDPPGDGNTPASACVDSDDEYSPESGRLFGYEHSQDDIDDQLHRESSTPCPPQEVKPGGTTRFPPNLDPEWLAFEVYTESQHDESDYDDADDDQVDDREVVSGDEESLSREVAHGSSQTNPRSVESETALVVSFEELGLASPNSPDLAQKDTKYDTASQYKIPVNGGPMFGAAKNSLSLLEVLLRLTILQQFQQQNHLEISDEILTFFLQESSTTGMDGHQRRRVRREARTKVGFDPYDESPVKRHGEEYQYLAQGDRHEDYEGSFYARPETSSRGGTPSRDFKSVRGNSARSSTPDRTPDSQATYRQKLDFAIPPGSKESRYPSMNIYQSSPLAAKKTHRPIEVRDNRGFKGDESILKNEVGSRKVGPEKDEGLRTSPGVPFLP